VLGLLLGCYGILYAIARPTADLWGSQMHARYASRTFTESNTLKTGTWAERVTGIETPGHGIVMTRAVLIPSNGPGIVYRPGTAVALPGHSLVTIRTSYRVVDCKHATLGPLPIIVHLRHLWITASVSYQDHGVDFPDAGRACGLYR